MPQRIVFTGGTGKAGRHVLPVLLSHGYEILNVDLRPFDHPGFFPSSAMSPMRRKSSMP